MRNWHQTHQAKQDLAAKPTKDLVAYDSYLRGLALQSSGNSAGILRRAIEADSFLKRSVPKY